MELLQLDVRTLAFISGLGGLIMAVTMAGLYLAGTRKRALWFWTGSGFVFFLGYSLGVILLSVPTALPAWFWANFANALFGLAHGLLLLGVQHHLDRRPWYLTVLLIVLAAFLAMFLVPEMRESLRGRIIAVSGVYIFFDVTAGVLLWRAREEGLTLYRRGVGLVLLLFGGFLALRFGYALTSPALTTSFVQDPFQMATFLVSTVFAYAITISLALMLFRGKEIELRKLARSDPLTGLYNRYSLDEHANREVQRSKRYQMPLSLIVLDIDRFKRINDAYGHAAGDRVLIRVARELTRATRETDIVFRIGGEEFLILLSCTSSREAAVVAERLRSGIESMEVDGTGRSLSVTASFGVSELAKGEGWEVAFNRADSALYEAKRRGRNRIAERNPGESEALPAPRPATG